MCRDSDHGGRRCSSQAVNTARRQVNRLSVTLADRNLSEVRRATLDTKFESALERLDVLVEAHDSDMIVSPSASEDNLVYDPTNRLNPEQISSIVALREEIVDAGELNSAGGPSCGVTSEELAGILGGEERYGAYDTGTEAPEHAWVVLPDGTIVDATGDQFGQPAIQVIIRGDVNEAKYLDQNGDDTGIEDSPVPAHLMITGAELNALHKFHTVLPSEFDSEKINPVINREGSARAGYYLNSESPELNEDNVDDGPLGKPAGGLWLSPVNSEGSRSEWAEHDAMYDSGNDSNTYEVAFNPDARIVTIDSWEDYKELVDSCSRDASVLIWDDEGYHEGTVKGIDYTRLNADAIYVSGSAIFQTASKCRNGGYADSYESLYGWDISSAVVINPAAITARKIETIPVVRDTSWQDRNDED